MMVMRARRLVVMLLAVLLLLLGTLYGFMKSDHSQRAGRQTSLPASTDAGPRSALVMAHRGGAGLWPENTLYAFSRAAEMGVDVLEMDLQPTADGALVVIHDDTVERTTNGRGPVSALNLDQLKRLDAAYNFSTDGGRSFPLRGRGLTVPTLDELFGAFPQMRFNIDIKQARPSSAGPLCRLIRERAMTDKVMIASFDDGALDEFRRECPGIATSASPSDMRKFLDLKSAGDGELRGLQARALQIPEYAGGRILLTKELVEAAHRHRLQVHAWTINDEAGMRRMLSLGVDGIITDYPDRLMALLGRAR